MDAGIIPQYFGFQTRQICHYQMEGRAPKRRIEMAGSDIQPHQKSIGWKQAADRQSWCYDLLILDQRYRIRKIRRLSLSDPKQPT